MSRTFRSSWVLALAFVGGGSPLAAAAFAGSDNAGIAARAFSCGDLALEAHPPRILVEAPAEAVVGEDCRYTFLVGETWGPEGPVVPTAGISAPAGFRITVSDTAAELPDWLHMAKEDAVRGRGGGNIVFRTPGLHRIVVESETGLRGESAPIRVLVEAPSERVYWGDLQAHLHTPGFGHAGYLPAATYATCVREALEFGRDVSNLDFCALTPHFQTAGGLARRQGSPDSPWDTLLQEVEQFHEPGRFVVFPGFEWQGPEGDHCVILPGPGPLVAPLDFNTFVDTVGERGALLTAHAIYLPTRFEKRGAALAGVEVMRDSQSTERLGEAALARGLCPAFLGCSDTHGGALGATSLTGLRTDTLSRPGIFAAILAGKTWATNGERIVLDFAVDTTQAVPTLRLSGVGTGPIDHVELFRNGCLLETFRDFADSVEFAVTHEDRDVLSFEWLDESVIYHARIVQQTKNRYDPSRRDIATTSPIRVWPSERFFSAGLPAASPSRVSAAFLELRRVLDSFRAAPGLRLSFDPGEGVFPSWTNASVAALRNAVQAVRRLALEDPSLVELSETLASAPQVAEAILAASELLTEIELAESGDGRPSPGALARFDAGARALHDQVVRARAAGRSEGWARLEGDWHGVRLLERLGRGALEALAELREGRDWSASILYGDPTEEISRLPVPIDPRLLAAIPRETPRERELLEQLVDRWGYTRVPAVEAPPAGATPGAATTAAGEARGSALRLRVVAEGSPAGAALRVDSEGPSHDIPVKRGDRGWVAELAADDLPLPGDPPPVFEFASPVRMGRVFVEGVNRYPLRLMGRLGDFEVRWNTDLMWPALEVLGDSLEVRIEAEVAGGKRVLADAVFPPGKMPLAFSWPPDGPRVPVVAHWGFAGWRRAQSTEVPGSDLVRPVGFGAVADGRAVLAYGDHLLLVDPGSGERDLVPYPVGNTHERGREFCVASLADGTLLIRGASGEQGGWVSRLDPVAKTWSGVPPGPEAGTVAALPQGGYAWLAGRRIHRRDAEGRDLPLMQSDVTGCLLGFDCAERPVVRVQPCEAVRLDASSGAVIERIQDPVLAVDPAGALVILDGHDRRHPELALVIRLRRSLPDGGDGGTYRLPFKTSPVLDPPVRVAALPDGALLLLGGTTWWRREPDHDWWGVTVERWDPVWTGVARGE